MKKEDLGTICWIEIRKDGIEKIMCVRGKKQNKNYPSKKKYEARAKEKCA